MYLNIHRTVCFYISFIFFNSEKEMVCCKASIFLPAVHRLHRAMLFKVDPADPGCFTKCLSVCSNTGRETESVNSNILQHFGIVKMSLFVDSLPWTWYGTKMWVQQYKNELETKTTLLSPPDGFRISDTGYRFLAFDLCMTAFCAWHFEWLFLETWRTDLLMTLCQAYSSVLPTRKLSSLPFIQLLLMWNSKKKASDHIYHIF
jgi:hypothetical protein